ncbi:MAG: hypothetical protein V4864_12405 [Pseudomonadota bacterium]
MSQNDDDARWLAVLAGRAQPDDDATREAAQYRAFFVKQADGDLARQADDATRIRAMNHLRGAGAFAAPKKAVAAPPPGGFQAMLQWLFPPGRSGARYALVAAVVLAVLAAPLVFRPDGGDAPGQIKSLPGGTRDAQELVLVARDPVQRGREIENALIAAGVAPLVEATQQEVLLAARIAPADLAGARQALRPLGVPVPDDGQLRLRIRRQN